MYTIVALWEKNRFYEIEFNRFVVSCKRIAFDEYQKRFIIEKKYLLAPSFN